MTVADLETRLRAASFSYLSAMLHDGTVSVSAFLPGQGGLPGCTYTAHAETLEGAVELLLAKVAVR